MLSRRSLGVLAAVGAGVRLVWVLVAHRTPQGLRDPFLYQRFAESIASGKGYASLYGRPTSYYPPGYPVLLGAIQWSADRVGLGEHLPLLAGIAQALLGGVAVAATAWAGARVGGRAVGTAAGLILALWPNLVLYSSTLLSESLYVAVFALLLAALVDLGVRLGAPPDPTPAPAPASDAVPSSTSDPATLPEHVADPWRPAAVAGALLGATALVRPQVLLLVPAIGLAWSLGVRRRGSLRAGVVLVAAATLVIAPWTVRNAVVLGGFVPVSTNGGDNLCVGFHDGAPGHFAIPAACDTGEFYVDGPAAELRRDAETARRARSWAVHHLGALPTLSARKLFHTYRTDADGLRAVESYEADRWLPDGVRLALRALSEAAWTLIAVAAVVGTGALARRWRRDPGSRSAVATLLAVTAASALVPVLFFGDGRFKVPTTPCLAILAAVAVVAARDRRRRHPQPPAIESS